MRSVRGAVGPFGASESETVTGVCVALAPLGTVGLAWAFGCVEADDRSMRCALGVGNIFAVVGTP